MSAAAGRDAGGRLVFANHLRGLAAACVACSHLVGVYWLIREAAAAATLSPVQPGEAPAVVGLVTFAWLNLGQLGVAVFFLISGLVVPFSLDRLSAGRFLLARALRIFPVYWAALAVQLAAIALAGRHWGIPFGYDAATILGNAALLYNFLGQPSIDLVNWTLGVELRFYLLVALLAPWVRRGAVTPLLLVAALVPLLNLALASAPLAPLAAARPALVEALRTEPVHVVFLLVGVLFHYRLRGQVGAGAMLAAQAALGLLFVAGWRTGAMAGQWPVVPVNYAYAYAIFGTLFALRRHARPWWPLDALAAVSFPLYLVHSLLGYALLKVLMLSGGLGYGAAMAATVPAVLGVATLLHRLAERPSIAFGRRLRPPAAPGGQ